jgi:hypothetical protein
MSASPQNGYDRYVELSAAMTYTGGLTIPSGDTAYIKGNGAVIDLQGSMIHVGGNTVRLDIDHCVLINGGNPIYGPGQAALNFVASRGSVTNNTIYGNTVGVRVYLSSPNAVTVKNNIITNNAQVGVLCEVGSEANVVFNDAWGNFMYGSYALDYYCVNGGIQPWSPVPGTGNISQDPLYVDAAARDFHLKPGSPCVGAGDPAGTDMGALSTGGGGGGGDEVYFKTYYPTVVTMLKGTIGSGSHLNLGADDGSYLSVNAVKSNKKFYTDWCGQTAIAEMPMELTITYNGRYSTSRTQTLYLYNFSTSAWTQINLANVGTTDATKTYTTTSPADFLSATGEIRVRVAASANNRTYSCHADYLAYTIKYSALAPLAFEPSVEELTFSSFSGSQQDLSSAPPAVVGDLDAWPNPFNPSVRISFELERPMTGELSVYDVSGRKVVGLARGTLDAGPHVLVWDGRDSDGRMLSSGTYIARLEGEGVSQSLKLVMLK